jgi:hypothetical protein
MVSVPRISQADGRPLRIRDAAKAAWRDLCQVIKKLPRVWTVALAINVGLSILALLMDGNGAGTWVGSIMIGVANSFFQTPYIIAIHRLIILNEIAPSYVLRPGEPRFKRFFGWSLTFGMAPVILFALLSVFPVLIIALTGTNAAAMGTSFIATSALIFAFCWAAARLLILFPAIAVDAAAANWRNTMADTKGYAWRICLIALLSILPFLPVEIVFGLAVGRGTVAGAMIKGLVNTVSLTMFVVIASHLYQRLGNNVNRSSVV